MEPSLMREAPTFYQRVEVLAGLSFADTGRSVRVQDPWGTPVTLSLPGTGTEELLAR